MPRYAYACECGNKFEVLYLSFSGADAAEKAGVECQKCNNPKTPRNPDPQEAYAGGGFRRYGLWTYGGAGNE